VSVITTKEKDFEALLISEYIKYGSIDQVFSAHKYSLPISFASYHRLLNKYKIIKSAGPNSKLSESLNFLSQLSDYKIPLEKVYHRHAPATMQISTNTLHRILHYTRLKMTRRTGAALLISKESAPDMYLLGKDQSLNNSALGQTGDFSLPMTHSRADESSSESIIRVMQQELFLSETSLGKFPNNLISNENNPIMYINIADIKVSVYRLILPDSLCNFSSFRLSDYQFLSATEVASKKLRPGVGDIVKKFEEIRFMPVGSEIVDFDSTLNATLYAWCSKI
jgi:hypothetical protein